MTDVRMTSNIKVDTWCFFLNENIDMTLAHILHWRDIPTLTVFQLLHNLKIMYNLCRKVVAKSC